MSFTAEGSRASFVLVGGMAGRGARNDEAFYNAQVMRMNAAAAGVMDAAAARDDRRRRRPATAMAAGGRAYDLGAPPRPRRATAATTTVGGLPGGTTCEWQAPEVTGDFGHVPPTL